MTYEYFKGKHARATEKAKRAWEAIQKYIREHRKNEFTILDIKGEGVDGNILKRLVENNLIEAYDRTGDNHNIYRIKTKLIDNLKLKTLEVSYGEATKIAKPNRINL